MDLPWNSFQMLKQLASQVGGSSDRERGRKIAKILNRQIDRYPPARGMNLWNERMVARYLKRFREDEDLNSLEDIGAGPPPWTRPPVQRGFWSNPDNRRAYMKWLGELLGYTRIEDWYNLRASHFWGNFGKALFRHHYKSSPIVALEEHMPSVEWPVWLFTHVPNGFWRDPSNRRKFMDYLASLKDFRGPEDWYSIKHQDFVDNGGMGLVNNYYGGSPVGVVKEYLPNYPWLEWKFGQTPQKFWASKNNRLRYFIWLLNELGLRGPEGCYQIKLEHLLSNYGAGLLPYCGSSTYILAKECFPKYNYLPWKFEMAPHGFWRDKLNQQAYLKWLGVRLGFLDVDDWYCVTADDLIMNFGNGLLAVYDGSPWKIVVSNLQNPNGWHREEFEKRPRVNRQRHLFRIIKRLFPNRDISYDFPHPDLRFSHSGRKMTFDIFIHPDTAIEYQSQIHFYVKKFYGGRDQLDIRQARDQEKKDKCRKTGITLIEVLYKWDGSVEEIVNLFKAEGLCPEPLGGHHR